MSKIDKYSESFKIKHESFMAGCDSIEEMGLWDIENFGEMDVFYTNDLISVILRLIAADGTITDKEAEYLNKNFGFDYSRKELVEIYDNCHEEMDRSFDEDFKNGIAHLNTINEKMAAAYKELLSLICSIIIESDGIISEEEAEEVKRLKSICL